MQHAIALLLVIVSTNVIFGQSPAESEATRPFDPWLAVSRFRPYHENSAGEQQIFELIETWFEHRGIAVGHTDLDLFPDAHSFSRVLEAVLPPTTLPDSAALRGSDEIVFAIPVNHRFDDEPPPMGSLSTAAALAISEQLLAASRPVAVRFVFLGGEKEPDWTGPLGSRSLVERIEPGSRMMLLYLDLDTPGETVAIDAAAPGLVAPAWALRKVTRSLGAEGIPYRIFPTRMQLYRARFADDSPVLRAYLESGIPALRIRFDDAAVNGTMEASRERDRLEQLVAAAAHLVQEASPPFPTEWDRHYVAWLIGDRLFVVGERAYVISVLILAAVALLYSAVFRFRFKQYTMTVSRNANAVPLIAGLLFLSLLLSGTVLARLLAARSYADLWVHRPQLFVAMKLLIAVFLFSVTLLAGRKRLLNAPSRFYSAAALIVTFVAVVAVATVQLSFTIFFLWSVVWVFLFTLVPYRPLKLLCLLIAPLAMIVGALQMTSGEELTAVRLMLFSPIRGNLLLTVAILPFLLMLIRLDFAVRHPRAGRRSFLLRIVATLSAVLVLASVPIALSMKPYTPEHPEPVRVHEEIDHIENRHRIVIVPRSERTDISFAFDDRRFLWQGRPIVLGDAAPADHGEFSIDSDSVQFLERRRIRIRVSSPDDPVLSIDVELRSDSPLVVYDANFPILLSDDGRSARVVIGALPPLPLTIDLTVSDRTDARAYRTITRPFLSAPLELEVDDAAVTTARQTVRFVQDL